MQVTHASFRKPGGLCCHKCMREGHLEGNGMRQATKDVLYWETCKKVYSYGITCKNCPGHGGKGVYANLGAKTLGPEILGAEINVVRLQRLRGGILLCPKFGELSCQGCITLLYQCICRRLHLQHLGTGLPTGQL